MASLEILIEKSDSGKLFFGVLRDNPRTRECYTFDAVRMPGRLIELVRDAIVTYKNKSRGHVDFNMIIKPDKKMVYCESRSHPGNLVRAAEEIERAYKIVSIYQRQFDNDHIRSLHPELAEYLDHIAVFPSSTFREKYRFAFR